MKGEDPIIWQIILQLLLILINAIFAAAEIAVISINDNKLAKLASSGNKKAIRLEKLTKEPARFLATIQVGITLAGFLGSAFAADNFASKLVTLFVSWGVRIPVETLNTISVIVITIILSYFTLVLGELVPKRIAMRHSEKLGLAMSGFVSAIARIFKPVVWFLTKSTNFLLRLLGIDPEAEDDTVTEEEIRMLVDAGSEKGAIDIEEKEMIHNIFEFDDTAVSEIMTHRTEVSVLWLDETDKQWAETIEGSHYSIYPICAETADDIVGVLYTKDYFRLKDKSRENVMKDAVRPAYLVPETVKINVLFKNMKQHRNHFAVVLDEYGGMSGIVTINDLLEELVGDMEDHYDKPNDVPLIERIDSNTWKIQGIMTLDELSKELGIIFPEEEYDTFGGFVFDLLGTIPEDGSTPEVEGLGLVIKVTEIKDHRMESAIVYKSRDAETIDAIDINDKDY